jgi:hypothetical protein
MLRENNVVHRDLKPQVKLFNLLLLSGYFHYIFIFNDKELMKETEFPDILFCFLS